MEIAKCSEKAYSSLPIQDGITLLYFKTQDELLAFCRQVNWNIDLKSKRIVFEAATQNGQGIPVDDVVHNVLNYAKELEQIV